MKQLLTLIIIGVLIWAGLKFNAYFTKSLHDAERQVEGPPRTAPGKLPGMSPDLEPSLETAVKGGAEGLAAWLNQHRNEVEDPRLAEIEMGYVVLVGRSNPAEARRILGAIKPRVGSTSPLYKRFQQLEKAYQ